MNRREKLMELIEALGGREVNLLYEIAIRLLPVAAEDKENKESPLA